MGPSRRTTRPRGAAAWAAVLCLAFPLGPATAQDGRAAERKSGVFVGDLMPDDIERTNEAEAGPPVYQRSGYLWPHTSGPYYGDVEFLERTAAGVIHTAVGSFRLDHGPLPFPRELTAGTEQDRKKIQYFIVQVRPETLTKERLETLYGRIRGAGGEVIRQLPVAALIARLTPAAHEAVLGIPDLVAVEPYHPALKLDPTIGRTPLYDPRKALSDVLSLDVSLHRGESSQAAAEALRALGAEVGRVWSSRIQIEFPAQRLAELAALDAVAMVHERLPHLPWDQKITGAVQTGGIHRNSNPFHAVGIRGAGQVLMVLDDGIQLDAADLSDTSTSPGAPGPGHRKVRFYGTTGPFGGAGDDRGCDSPAQGGFTHGHVVSAVALGNAAHADVTFRVTDANGRPWELTGVAPDAALVAYDAAVTPTVGGCLDVQTVGLDVGQLYDPEAPLSPTAGSLPVAYQVHGARTFNLSWGSDSSAYSANALEVDAFLNDNTDAMVFIAVGNRGDDELRPGTPDLATIGEPATAKNSVSIGSHGGPDDFVNPANIDERSFFSGTGPAGATGRIAPLLMAPGQERGSTGKPIAFSCRTNTNDSAGAVVCDSVSARAGTSFAAAAASGAALLVRDYFAQGFHPDGTSGNAENASDVVPNVSGALVKSVLIASAEFLGNGFTGTFGFGGPADNLTRHERFNTEQGYGRIQLDNALPLEGWAATASGLLVVDGGIAGGVNDLSPGLSGSIDAVGGAVQTATFEVCDDSQELHIALAWVDPPGDALINDLNLSLVAPDGKEYFGNYFTDDDDRNGSVNMLTENCPSPFDDGTPRDNGLDRSAWSLPVCTRPGNGGTIPPSLSPRDSINPTEAIFLTPNPEGRKDESGEPILRTGVCLDAAAAACGNSAQCEPGVECVGGTSQVLPGTYTLQVQSRSGGSDPEQGYALVVSGGICRGSSAVLDATRYVCSDTARVTITEHDEASDPASGLSAEAVAARTTVQVLAADGSTILDSESGSDLGFLRVDPAALRFVSDEIIVTDATAYDPGNGVLDVRDGDVLRVVYADESVGGVGGDPAKLRSGTAAVDCGVDIVAGKVRFSTFGTNPTFLVSGGCERNARGLFEFGYPDRYMDAGESIAYRVAWASAEFEPLERISTELSCVFADADSPADCRPGTDACPDPERENNLPCSDLTILDPLQVIGVVDPLAAVTSNFQIQMNSQINGSPDIEMLLRITADAVGKNRGAMVVNRHRLNVDEVTVRYNTDFPGGGTLMLDRNNDGLIENPVTTGITGFPTSNNTDYFFETVHYSDLTQGIDGDGSPVTVNDGIQAPWNFDASAGGFTTGIVAGSDDGLIAQTIAQWGEDMNFNNLLDGVCLARRSQSCDRFPLDALNCGFCDEAATSPGVACATGSDCPGGACDFGCVNLEDRDPENFPIALLDQNWSTRGGCGWQTRAPHTCSADASRGCYNDGDCAGAGTCSGPEQATGGIWHTGRIGNTTEGVCSVVGAAAGQCQMFETISGLQGQLSWFELLVTPELTKVNQRADPYGSALATAEITGFSFNWAVDLPDNNVSLTLEFDNDTESLEPVDLKSDFTVLRTLTGRYGAVSGGGNPLLTRGWGLFAPLDPSTGASRNGTVGNNRMGKNACFFEGGAVPRSRLLSTFTGLPPDDDVNEGYCPYGEGVGGTDPHLNYCTLVCTENGGVKCETDAACAGTCVGGPSGFCSHAPLVSCTAHGDCDLGTCADLACNGSCVDGACSNGKPGGCAGDSECQSACVFTTAAIDEFVQPNGPVRGVELNDLNGPDMRFQTLLDIFGTESWGVPVGTEEPCGTPQMILRRR